MNVSKHFTLFLIVQSTLLVCSSEFPDNGDPDRQDVINSPIQSHSKSTAHQYEINNIYKLKPATVEESQNKIRRKRKLHKTKPDVKPKMKSQNIITEATKTNFSTNPIISPLNNTSWFKENNLERQATNAMLSMSALLILLFVCVFWSGMLKQKNSYMYPAQDGSWQSAEQKDKLFSVNIKELIQSKLRSLRLPKVRTKRKRKSKGTSYLELKQKDMSSTSEEDFYMVT